MNPRMTEYQQFYRTDLADRGGRGGGRNGWRGGGGRGGGGAFQSRGISSGFR